MIEDGGAWSGTTAGQVGQVGTSYDWLTSVDGVLHWVESSSETGRAVVMSWDPRGVHPAAVRGLLMRAWVVGCTLTAVCRTRSCLRWAWRW
jgi:hypothetical protein